MIKTEANDTSPGLRQQNIFMAIADSSVAINN